MMTTCWILPLAPWRRGCAGICACTGGSNESGGTGALAVEIVLPLQAARTSVKAAAANGRLNAGSNAWASPLYHGGRRYSRVTFGSVTTFRGGSPRQRNDVHQLPRSKI